LKAHNINIDIVDESLDIDSQGVFQKIPAGFKLPKSQQWFVTI
jgi:hypothetical protein